MNVIKSIYVDILACVRVKGGEKECFRIDSGVRQGCIMSPCLFNIYMDSVSDEGNRGRFFEVCRRRGLKVNAGKRKVMLLDRECSRKVVSEGTVVGAIRSLVNDRSLQLECAGVLHESLLVPVFTFGSETMIWREKERSRIRDVQMDNLRGLLGIRRIDKFPSARIR